MPGIRVDDSFTWSGNISLNGTLNAGSNPINIFDSGGQTVTASGGPITANALTVYATANSSYNAGLTYTGPVSGYSVWINGTQQTGTITVPSGQTQTFTYAANTGLPGSNGLAAETFNTGTTSSTFGPGVTGFTFGPVSGLPTLTSLDLTNATVKADIIALVNAGIISGTSTSVVIPETVSSAYVTLSSLTALNIPQNDAISFTGFTVRVILS